MKVLIIGVNGFIGQYLCKLLMKQHEIIGIGKSDKPKVVNIQYIQLDISNHFLCEKLKDIYPHVDIIVNVAACIDYNDFNEGIIYVNCLGSLHILQYASEAGCSKIINISSIPVIGKPVDLPVTEDHIVKPETMYHISKLTAEYIFAIANKYGITTVSLRISSPVGCGMSKTTFLPTMIEQCRKNEMIKLHGTGSRRQNYVDVRDISIAVELAIEKNAVGIFNIASDRTYSNLEVVQLCKQLLNSSSEISYSGTEDPDDYVAWEISIDKAKEKLVYEPRYSLADTICTMLTY